MIVSIPHCSVCSNNQFEDFLTCEDFTVSHEKFQLKKCLSCGFVVTNPRPDRDTIGSYYLSDKYISHTGGSKGLFDKIYLMARQWTLRWKSKIVQKNSSGNKILDFGCGTGEFIQQMKSNGFEPTGVEPSSIARESAKKKTGTKVNENLSEINEVDFDVITLWHVLEHVHDLNETLQNLHKLLKESGTIIIAVPNLHSFDAKHYAAYWAAYDVPRHLWHFSKETITLLLEKNGFQLIKILPMRLDSFYVSLLSETYKYPHRSKLHLLFNAVLVGLKSNANASKTLDYSSHIYIAKR